MVNGFTAGFFLARRQLMPQQSPELPRLRRLEAGHTMVSITSLRAMRRLLVAVIALQVINLALEVW